MVPTTTIASQQETRFEARAASILGDLREAFLGLMEGLPKPVHRAADLEKALGLSRTLGWQVYRVASGPNPLTAAAHVPGLAAVRLVLDAAQNAGVAESRVQAAARAMQAFEALVEEHAGDRATFVTMMDSLAGREAEGIDLKTRRQAFRINSQVWGVQVKTFLTCSIIHPGSDPTVYDNILLGGLREIRRIRAGTALRLSSQRVFDAHRRTMEAHAIGDSSDAPKATPMERGGSNLLLDFCTKPYPQLDTVVDDEGTHFYLRQTPLGNAGLQSLFAADLTRDMQWQSEGDVPNHFIWFTAIMKPIEALVLDTLIHRDMFGRLEPQAAVYGSLDRLGETDPDKYRSHEVLPIEAPVHNLGIGAGRVTTPHVPRYREMVESVCRRAGWNSDEFEVFRCIVEYPMLNTMVQMRFELPERGNW